MRFYVPLSTCLLAALLANGCGKDPPAPTITTATPSAAPIASAAPAKPREPLKAPERSGGSLQRAADGSRLFLADEDHKVLRILPLPLGEEPKPLEARKPSSDEPAAASASASAKPAPPVPSASASAMASASASSAPSTPPSASAVPPHPPPPSAKQIEMAMPGAPAQVLVLDKFVLVTIRDPGLLLVFKVEADESLKEQSRVPVAADAWGIALTPDEKTAIVTSAWTHTVTGIDIQAGKVLWTQNVAREPRGVVIHPNGKTAYVSHLTSANLTRIDDLDGDKPKTKKIDFPASPLRTPYGTKVDGSLGYALVIDDAGHRLLAARHALGALGPWGDWYGVMSIDALQTDNDQPLLKPRVPGKRIKTTPAYDEVLGAFKTRFPESNYRSNAELFAQRMPQPRAMIVARSTDTVWVASEGQDSVAEYPLHTAVPSERTGREILLGRNYKDPKIIGSGYSDRDGIPSECGAPTGLALSPDESLLYVYCRSTNDIAIVRIGPQPPSTDQSGWSDWNGPGFVRVATETDEALLRGKKLFYGANDAYSSDELGCAACHPEGRDDGHVWHEVITNAKENEGNFLATQYLAEKTKEGKLGYPRQTPMLAGRVNAKGPYGWHAQSDGLLERIGEGFGRHRWIGRVIDTKAWMLGERANALTVFLRKGLVPPPRINRELTAKEKKGKEIFESAETACVQCHPTDAEFTNRMAMPLPKLDTLAGFEDEENPAFKSPSLLFVGGTAPYYHDGSMPSLDVLIAKNNDRMGKTNQLSAEQRAALVAYLETL